MKGRKPCRNTILKWIKSKDDGRIDVLKIVESDIITGGDDGYIRVWSVEVVKNAEVLNDENSNQGSITARIYEIEPTDEIFVGKDIKIKGIAFSASLGTYIIQCSNGVLYKLDLQHSIVEPLFKFQAGSLITIANPLVPGLISLSEDGTLRLYNNMDKKIVAEKSYASPGTALRYLSEVLDPQMCTFAAGYADGTLRFFCHDYLHLKSSKFHLMSVFKAHSKPITGIFYNTEASYLISVSDDKNLFIFRTSCVKVNDRSMTSKDFKVVPVGFVPIGSVIKDVIILDKSTKECVYLMVLLKNGESQNLMIDLSDWTSEDSYEILKSRIETTTLPFLSIAELDPSFAEISKSMERLNMKAAPKLKITNTSIISHLVKIDLEFSLIAVINCDNETEIRLIQLSARDSSMYFQK